MGPFRWLFRRGAERPGSSKKSRNVAIDGPGEFDFDIVGESFNQGALNRICGGKTDAGHELEVTAVLIEEPENPHDPNAVKVVIAGETVGHLCRLDAKLYKARLARAGLTGEPVSVEAIITGGWDRGARGEGHYGVKLDMENPPDFVRH